jgi:2-keto-4-pentenoate hydratase/2-oxohepta-3-ene-1,7-dioic acid hydratase in catechol pathway
LTDSYYHRRLDDSRIALPVGKVVCVGRNYAAHAKELDNPVPASPLLFIKPATALVPLTPGFRLPAGRGVVHHETEVALLVGKALDSSMSADPLDAITGVGIALDLTLREVQDRLKKLGHPWEIAKGFDGACPCSAFIDADRFADLQNISFLLRLNQQTRQSGNTREMLFPIRTLIEAIVQHFSLLPGDVILTGTPAGVGPLLPGDRLTLEVNGQPDDPCQGENPFLFKSRVFP